jgi:hypothetical protein
MYREEGRRGERITTKSNNSRISINCQMGLLGSSLIMKAR